MPANNSNLFLRLFRLIILLKDASIENKLLCSDSYIIRDVVCTSFGVDHP